MGFFLETHNGECGLGKHFCDQQMCLFKHLISWYLIGKLYFNTIQNPGRGN